MSDKVLKIILLLTVIALTEAFDKIIVSERDIFTTKVSYADTSEAFYPNLYLSINNYNKDIITQGTPLIFELVLRNDLAADAATAKVKHERFKQQLNQMVKKKEITPEEAEDLLKLEPAAPSVKLFIITVDANSFTFSSEGIDKSKHFPLPKVIEPAAPFVITLDENETAYATAVVSPESTASLEEGTYRIVAHFENRTDKGKQWKGKVDSNTLVLNVIKSMNTSEERLNKYMAMAEYFMVLRDYENAQDAIKQIFSIEPEFINGFVLRGNIHEAKGEFKEALEAYEKAFKSYRRLYPKFEPHWGLMGNIRRMRDKLGIELPEVIE
jgi:hypothetical protein